MVNDAVAEVARAAAGVLVPRHGPRLAADAEAAIHTDTGECVLEQNAPGQYLDPVALGALIVAMAQFGYQVYTDRKNKGQQPTRETIAQAIRIERRKHSDLTSEETEIIDIVSAKVIERGERELRGSRRYPWGSFTDGTGTGLRLAGADPCGESRRDAVCCSTRCRRIDPPPHEVRRIPESELLGYTMDRTMRIRINDFLPRNESPVIT